MKIKIVDEAITGILLAIVTINVFVVFLPQWIATVLGLLILCKLLYEYLPAITRKLYETPEGRIFTERRWIRLLILGFAIPGYFMAFLSQHVYLVLFTLVVAVFALGFPLAYAWNKENKGVPPNQQSFWKVTTNKTLSKEWEKYKKAPNKLSTFSWYYTPGIYLSAMGIGFFCIFWLISSCSQFFTLLFIGWLIKQYFYKIHSRRAESPDIKLFKSLSAFEGGWKGIFGFLFIFIGFIIPGMWISSLLCYFIPLINAINSQYLSHLLILFSQLPSGMYQILFWYAILERFPHFLQYWKSGLQEEGTLSLPTGHIYAFVGSCIFPFYVIIIPSLLQRVLFLKLFHYYLIFSVLLIINFAYIGLIVHTLLKWRGGKTLRDAYKDNIKIPLALSAQFMVIFLAGYIVKKSIFKDLSLLSLLTYMILIILFFTEDWQNFLEHQYEEGLTNEILGILPAFVGLIIANIITFVWAQPIFYFILILSIIAVPFGIPGISNKMLYYLLRKFCVPLTNEIFKALDIIKKSCNRLFLALHRKEVINKVINGILLAVVTVNTLVSFLPKSAAITLGVLILGKLLYEYLPAITARKIYGPAEQQWVKLLEKLPVRMFIVCFAALGYFLAEVTDIVPTILIMMVIIALVVSFPFAAWGNKKVREPFWNVIAEVEGNPAFKNLGDYYKNLSDSLTKRIEISLWWYLPGIFFSTLCILFSGVFYIISIYSQFFTIIFVGWILSNISTKFKWKSKNPDLEKKLLTLPLAIEGGVKGVFVYLFIFGGFVISGVFIFGLFYLFPCTKAINTLYLLLLSPPGIYQFVFWYAMLMRISSFIYCWKNGFPRREGFSLPAGGLYAFITSCVYVCALFAFGNQLRDWKWIYLPLLSVMSFVYLVLILHTIKKWKKKETADDMRKDNIRLPLAFFVQLLPSFVVFYKVNPICSKDPLLYIILIIGVAIVASSLFFIQDWRNFLTQRYGNGLTKESLSYLPLFVFLLLADLLASILWRKDIFYLFLAISIMAVFLMCLEIGITYRKKQLSRAQESCKASSINHNDEKKLKKL